MKIVIIGCGRMGSGIAQNLVHSHHQVTVVDHDPQAFDRLGHGFSGQIVQSDALDQESFLASSVARADALAAVTGSDTANIVVARVAKQVFRVPKVIARIHDPLNAEAYRRLGVQTVTSVELGIMRISELLTFSHLDIEHSLGSGGVSIVMFEISPPLAGHSVNDISVPGEIQIVSLTRRGKTIIPVPGAIFEKGDLIHIAVDAGSVPRLKTLLRYT
ncbi:MAG TPA: NAD-binding protein [Methanospirillum sp.]|nr:NAD-binding protein [Methanospirillum sp.]